MNNGKICVPVWAETADEMIAAVKRAEESADIIEVRFDGLRPDELNRSVSNINSVKPLIATFRSHEEGGMRQTSLGSRFAFWQSLPDGFWAADLESDLIDKRPPVDQRIGSLHSFDDVPDGLGRIYVKLRGAADIVKIAVSAFDITDTIPLWDLVEQAKVADQPIIPIGMGEAGKWTRILGLAHGAFLTYGSLGRGKETADGQITAMDLIDVYRVKELNKNTRVFGIVGDPVSSSLSPFMQNPAFIAEEVNAVFIPLLVKNIDEFLRRMVRRETREVELNFGGFSVTMPHKQAIMKHLDEIDETAKKIGAVNTVKIDDDKLIGYNTDAHGFITPLKASLGDLKEARVSVGGAGGAARACLYSLVQEGADVTVCARDPKKAAALAEEFGVNAGRANESFGTGPIDILINATPLGMRGGETEATIATAPQLSGVKLVYDLVYNPVETRLMREAKAAGVPAIGGLEMLVTQGARQFAIWTGREAPVEVMKESVLKRINDGG